MEISFYWYSCFFLRAHCQLEGNPGLCVFIKRCGEVKSVSLRPGGRVHSFPGSHSGGVTWFTE